MNNNILIYVVEDNKLLNKLVVDFLKKKGLKRIKFFYTGQDCLKAVKSGGRPDVVIQDYHLEDSTGIAVLQAVKKRSKLVLPTPQISDVELDEVRKVFKNIF